MTVYKLITKEVDHVNYIKIALLLTDLCIKENMKENIAKFLGKLAFLTLKDCITKFIYFLQRLRTERFIRLLPVPRTFLSKFIEYFYNSGESLLFFL